MNHSPNCNPPRELTGYLVKKNGKPTKKVRYKCSNCNKTFAEWQVKGQKPPGRKPDWLKNMHENYDTYDKTGSYGTKGWK